MLELMKDLPAHVVGIRATGKVTGEELNKVLIPAIDHLVEKTNKIHYLLLLETDISNWDIGAWINDLKVGLKHFTKWNKIAVVSDQQGVNKFTEAFSLVVPGEAKSFRVSELQAARDWISA